MSARRSLPFERALRTVKINRMVEGANTTRENQIIETNINMVHSRVRFTIIAEGNFNMGVQQHKVNTSLENLKEVHFTNNSKLVPLTSMTLIHPEVRKLFAEEIPNVLGLAGRLSQFVKQWKKITCNQEILSKVKGYQIPFTNLPVQEKPPNTIKMSEQQSLLVDQKISELLEKGAIQRAEATQEEFLSNLFLVGKKDGGHRPVINLKKLNTFILTSTSKWKVCIVWNFFWKKTISCARKISKTFTLQFLSANSPQNM